jgi:hypothetical protein
MKQLSFLIISSLVLFLAACNDGKPTTQELEARVDSLQHQLKNVYKPGFGELMLNVQIHHAKLWYAGKNSNWPLAAYEESLIRSAFKKINTYHADDPATKATGMISLPLDSIDVSIRQKDAASFKRSFTFLTATCNNCHQVTKHGFNVIGVPVAEPIGNQVYEVK